MDLGLYLMASLYFVAGITHFTHTRFFEYAVPKFLVYRRFYCFVFWCFGIAHCPRLALYPYPFCHSTIFNGFFGGYLPRQYCANQLLQSKIHPPAMDVVGNSFAPTDWIDLLGIFVCLSLFCTL